MMPTSTGKSAIYQITGLMMDSPVLVISPLIVLQKDQVDSIELQKTKTGSCRREHLLEIA